MHEPREIVKQVGVWLGIVSLLPLAAWYGTSAIWHPPDWKGHQKDQDFETFWRQSVHDGVVAGTDAALKRVALKPDLRLTEARPEGSGAGGLDSTH